MPRKFYITKKLEDLPKTSGYFNEEPHGPTHGYSLDPVVQYVLRERERNKQDEKDKLLFEQLEREYLESQKIR